MDIHLKKLSPREVEVIKHTASGFTAKEIAKKTGLEHRTIEAYMTKIKRKLGARNSAHAVCIALCVNLVEGV